MSHTGIFQQVSWNILFKKFLSALLLTALVFGGTPMPASGIPPNPPVVPTIWVTTNIDKYMPPPFPLCILGPGGVIPGVLVQPISLREAICAANNVPGQIIGFNIIPPGIQTISVGSPPQNLGALPSLLAPMIIDGTTQPVWGGQPLIILDGTSTKLIGAFNGLKIAAPNVQIYGLGIQNFGANGIEISGVPNAVIQGNYIGIGPSGLNPPQPNSLSGVLVSFGAGNTIGGSLAGQGNVISGNLGDGVKILGNTSFGNKVQGNFIGTDLVGLSAAANGGSGVHVKDAPGNTIGGVNPGEGNLISGNTGRGIFIEGNQANYNLAQGNLIGTDFRGAQDLGNSSSGVQITDAMTTTVGGTVSAGRAM
jgi:hypothetical protein